jgi:hypothetical protein
MIHNPIHNHAQTIYVFYMVDYGEGGGGMSREKGEGEI